MNKDHNIEKEDGNAEGLPPKLSGLNSRNPFNPSDSYFDSFTSKLNGRIEDEEEIRTFAPTLLSFDKYNPFDVPADYFEELPSIIQEKVIADKKTPPFKDWLLFLFRPRFAIPVLVTVIVVVFGINYLNESTVRHVDQEELSLEDNLYYISESDIIDQLTADATIELLPESDEENNIENYLIDNNIEESNLSSEL